MKAILERLKSRIVPYSLLAGALIFALIALIIYTTNGKTEFNQELNTYAIASLIVGMILSLPPFFLPKMRILYFLPYLCYFFGFLQYLVSQDTYLANIFVSIDETSISATFLMITIFSLLAFVLALLSGIFAKNKEIKEDSYTIVEK